jgi:hypothetical protein
MVQRPDTVGWLSFVRRILPIRQEILRIKGEYRVDGFRPRIEETVFDSSNRQARIIRVARREWTPPSEFHFQGHLCILEADSPEWKSRLEGSLSKPRETPATARIRAIGGREKWP